MKKIIGLIVISMFLISGCMSKDLQSDKKTKLEEIKEQGKIVIGTSASYPPYEFHKEIDGKDEIVGFDIEIAKKIAEELGVQLEIKDMKFDGLIAALNSGNIDIIIAGMTPTDERKKSIDFSKIYYTATQSIVINIDNQEEIKTLDDLKTRVIGVQKGTIQEELAKTLVNENQIIGLAKAADVVLQLKTKKIDGLIFETPVAKSYVNKNEELIISEINLETNDSGSAIAIKKGNQDLVDIVNKTLDDLIENNKIEEFVVQAIELEAK